MELLLISCILIPTAGFVISILIPGTNERMLSTVAMATTILQTVLATGLTALWAVGGFANVDRKWFAVAATSYYEFFITLRFDKVTAVYAIVGAILASLVMTYSRTYLHREPGYKRFFTNTLFFFFGFNVVVFAGNLETLFVGWEVLGISSFLLIAFYRHRYLPVKNAVKVFSIYRIGDVGLLLAIWMSNHLWQQSVTFELLENKSLVAAQLQHHSLAGVVISVLLLLSASAKSAQLPFSSWLPRAMEGPTPSSAIFYGALSVHIGAFLLTRTFPFWEHQYSVRILIGLLGVSTSFVASGIARVQSSVKSQIAYASIAQIGIIFVELALGWVEVALLHFSGNAFLRTYQLLTSPSVVTYRIREQLFNPATSSRRIETVFSKRVRYAFYVLCLKEWNLDTMMYRWLWNPLKKIGNKLRFITFTVATGVFFPLIIIGFVWSYGGGVPPVLRHQLPAVFGVIALACSLKAFTERVNAKLSWVLIILNHFWIALAISFNAVFSIVHVLIYLSGVIVFGMVGWFCLRFLRKLEKKIDLDRFNGHAFLYPGFALIFLLCCLALAGFPITPTFIGEDLILTHIKENQVILAFVTALSFVINGLAIIRLYARIFLGPHLHSAYEMAYRSS